MTALEMTDKGTIYIVDDDPAVCDALRVVFELEGYRVTGFSEGASFLRSFNGIKPDCVILDVHMPGKSGLDILKEVNFEKSNVPVFIISGQGDIPMAVKAIKEGAFDFIEKPFDANTVVNRVGDAMTVMQNKRDGVGDSTRDFAGKDLLTPREIEVLTQITEGASNKEAGRRLGISPRTIEVHRARIMEKLGARNAADLVRIVLSSV